MDLVVELEVGYEYGVVFLFVGEQLWEWGDVGLFGDFDGFGGCVDCVEEVFEFFGGDVEDFGGCFYVECVYGVEGYEIEVVGVQGVFVLEVFLIIYLDCVGFVDYVEDFVGGCVQVWWDYFVFGCFDCEDVELVFGFVVGQQQGEQLVEDD